MHVVFILACLYCYKVRVVRTKVWCKMAGVTFEFHYHVSGWWFPTSGGGDGGGQI